MKFESKSILVVMAIVSILVPGVAGAQVHMKPRPVKEFYGECQNCHQKKSVGDVPKERQPVREHVQIKIKHGEKEMSCNHCHDKANHNHLREGIAFQAPSKVCFQCHSDVQKSWVLGLHGKRMGGWQGEREQFHCTECHNSHSVTFPQWKASPPPKRPKYSIPKNGSH